jgi:ABC-type nitrate/sulfonate/bicarbonate transport system ATPase subunit
MGAPALRVAGARLRYPHTTADAFSGVDLDVQSGETFALVGPSGCGKSSLLRAVAGLAPLTGGSIERADRRPPALVLQRPSLLPWLDVRANVALPHRFAAHREVARRVDVDELLADFGLASLSHAVPDELSGGQQQLVSVARAMATDPGVLLLDEPFAALDPAARRVLQDWLRAHSERRGLTAVLVTHDPDEALFLGHRVGLLRRGRPGIGPVWAPGRPDRAELATLPAREELLARYETDVTAGTDPVAELAAVT